MQINKIQTNSNLYSQPSFGAKMDAKLVKKFKNNLVKQIKKSSDDKHYILECTNLSKQFEQYLKDINTEKNISIIKTGRKHRYIVQKGLGYKRHLNFHNDYSPRSLSILMADYPAEKIKQIENYFIECERLKTEGLNNPFLSDTTDAPDTGNKISKFFRNLFGKTNK